MATSDLVGTKVLYVEDEPLLRSLVVQELQSRKLRVSVAQSISEALRIISNQEFDLLILDVNLGEGPSGIDMARSLRSQGLVTPILFLTNLDEPWLMDDGPGGKIAWASSISKRQLRNIEQLLMKIRLSIGYSHGKIGSDFQGASKLTPRQRAAIRGLMKGKSTSQIADELKISERAVNSLFARAAERLQIPHSEHQSRQHELIVWATAKKLGF